MSHLDLRISIAGRTAFAGEPELAITVAVPRPERIADPPIVLFLYPGGGYSRGYYHIQAPGLPGYDELAHHAEHGLIAVACDHIGVGDSSQPSDRSTMTYENTADANQAAAEIVLERLAVGKLAPGFPSVANAVAVGAGQSMGGCLLTVQQARHRGFAGVAMLGWSGVHTRVPVPPGQAPFPQYPWKRGDSPPVQTGAERPPELVTRVFEWGFHWADEPEYFLEEDIRRGFPMREGRPPMWASTTMPNPVSGTCLSAGCVAKEAAAIDVPVLIAVGERDVCPDPWQEPAAYRASRDISVNSVVAAISPIRKEVKSTSSGYL